MDQSDTHSSSVTSGVVVRQIVSMEDRQIVDSMENRQLDVPCEEDNGCNWDIEVLQFVVESFICLFPDRDRCGDPCGGDRRHEGRAHAYRKSHSNMSTGSTRSNRSTGSSGSA
ncbi:expressed unknown protein [Seminavis robusta]|uniref:Uncharacterized protein n=1 Tax=Seminavis robusta TaxID=568900 RepID=A0A9N8EC38_9STRA|nr:expressed unknown protein [Seminavis robusta]|eukprot:Sro873_g214030.1 n/a (113) ;mRNA; r:18328-18778